MRCFEEESKLTQLKGKVLLKDLKLVEPQGLSTD